MTDASLDPALRSPHTIRAQAASILALAESGQSAHFTVDWSRLPVMVDRVIAVTRASYPDLAAIPYHSRWRHFDAGGVPRVAALEAGLAPLDARERLRVRFDLTITSVLLDAGAGAAWSYREAETDRVFTRSEGLAVASWQWFVTGGLSSDAAAPLRADPGGLNGVTAPALARAFQVTDDNPLVGVDGRAALMRRLGQVAGRPGLLADELVARAAGGPLPAAAILDAVLERLGPLWPGRGDVWPHPQVGLVPFHKLSQWLTYSLIEPLEAAGVRVVELDALTGLPEYRNGGLFLDGGVLVLRDPAAQQRRHLVSSPLVIEWRALTVALLDRVAAAMRDRLGLDAAALPLAKVLEGGTWSAGRQLAAERRPGGVPPLQLDSDGTVF